MKRCSLLMEDRPGTAHWNRFHSAAAKAKGQTRDNERRRIIEGARDKGWRHWQGPFFFHLEKKLRAIGCPDPTIWTDELRDDRAFELEWAARHPNA